jgi:hypothetical protein
MSKVLVTNSSTHEACDTDLEPKLKLFYLENVNLDAKLKVYVYLLWHQNLNPTYGLEEKPMEYSFKENSMKSLVHRNCLSTTKNNCQGQSTLTIEVKHSRMLAFDQ